MNSHRAAPRRRTRATTTSASRRVAVEGLESRQLLTTFTPTTGDQLVAILNGTNSGTKLALGDTILLRAGTNYQSTTFSAFTLRNITQRNSDPNNDGWITIKSDMLDQMPAGKRVSFTDGQYMPKLWAAGNNVPAVNTKPGAHHFRFQGVEFVGYMQLTKDLTNTSLFTILDIGDSGSTQTTVAQQPHDIVIDRAYVHPQFISVDYAGTHNGTARDADAYLPNTYTDLMVRKGISLHAANVDITNSYIREIHEGSDSNAIFGVNGSGPYNIVNNYLEGAGENVLFGGGTQFAPYPDGYVVFRGNHVTKPLDWRNGTNGSRKWTTKNLFELKEGSHFVIEGNVFENSWVSGQDGIAILFKLGNYNDSTAAGGVVVTEDIIFRNNIVRHAARGITFQGRDYAASPNVDPGGLVRRFKIENNLWDDIGASNAFWGAPAPFAYLTHGPKYVEFRHNTINNGYTSLELDGNLTTWSSPGFVFTDNIVNMNDYGIRGSGGSGDSGIKLYLPDSLFKGNVFIDNKNNNPAPNYDNVAPSSWPGNKNTPRVRFINFWTTPATTGFVDAANGNYRLTPSAAGTYINGTPYNDTLDSVTGTTKTTDGTAPGADFDVLDGVLLGAISGVWPFAYVSGSQLFVHFDGSGTPISLTTSGANVVVQQGAQQLSVAAAGLAGIRVFDSTEDDQLQILSTLPAALLPSNTAGDDTIVVAAGATQTFDSDLSARSQYWSVPNWAVRVDPSGSAIFNSSQTLRSLDVAGSATLTAGGSKVLNLASLQLSGRLDLGDNDLLLHYTGTSPLAAINALVASGRNGGTWTGNGLVTGMPAAQPASHLTSLGVAEASDALHLTAGQTALWNGQTVDSSTVLVKYTYAGDADLNGKINGDDYFILDSQALASAFGGGGATWFNGDFDYSGKLNGDDYFILDSNLGRQGVVL
jgi:hypothetical protein